MFKVNFSKSPFKTHSVPQSPHARTHTLCTHPRLSTPPTHDSLPVPLTLHPPAFPPPLPYPTTHCPPPPPPPSSPHCVGPALHASVLPCPPYPPPLAPPAQPPPPPTAHAPSRPPPSLALIPQTVSPTSRRTAFSFAGPPSPFLWVSDIQFFIYIRASSAGPVCVAKPFPPHLTHPPPFNTRPPGFFTTHTFRHTGALHDSALTCLRLAIVEDFFFDLLLHRFCSTPVCLLHFRCSFALRVSRVTSSSESRLPPTYLASCVG